MRRFAFGVLSLLVSSVGCKRTPEPTPAPSEPAPVAEPATPAEAASTAPAAGTAPSAAAAQTTGGATGSAGSAATAAAATPIPPPPPGHRPVAAKPVAEARVSPDDPLKGKFSLAEATQGLTGSGPLTAEIKTSLGKLTCELYEDRAPITVANFVGLARGLRPFKNKGEWTKSAAYDGTTFHRVIKGFMIQGGDPAGTGAGEPGYVIPDEVWAGAYHSERGLICMANRGPNTNGMQFFIMDGSAPHLDSGYTIFGKCGPESVIDKIASVEVRGDRAVNPPKIEKVTIRRDAGAKKPAAPTTTGPARPATSAAP